MSTALSPSIASETPTPPAPTYKVWEFGDALASAVAEYPAAELDSAKHAARHHVYMCQQLPTLELVVQSPDGTRRSYTVDYADVSLDVHANGKCDDELPTDPDPVSWMVVRHSSHDHQDQRGDERVAAEGIPVRDWAAAMCGALNQLTGPDSDDAFRVESGTYKLRPKWDPNGDEP